MNTLVIAVFACLVVVATARPSIVGPGIIAGPAGAVIATGHAGIVAPGLLGGVGLGGWNNWNNGQWRGEGLLESQDWAGRGVAVVGAHGLGLTGWGGHGRW